MKSNKKFPLYYQVYQWMRNNIETNRWEIGMKLPSEPTLSKDIGVSRATLRSAIQLLIDDGICYQRPGKGTFIMNKRVQYELTILKSFTEQMEAKNRSPYSEILKFTDNHTPDNFTRLKLDLSPNDRVVLIKRIRFVDGIPISLETVCIDESICKDIQKYNLEKQSIYRILEHDFNIPIVNGELSIESNEASTEEAEHLKVKPGTSLLHIDAINYTENERPIFVTYAKYPKDRYTFTINMSRRNH